MIQQAFLFLWTSAVINCEFVEVRRLLCLSFHFIFWCVSGHITLRYYVTKKYVRDRLSSPFIPLVIGILNWVNGLVFVRVSVACFWKVTVANTEVYLEIALVRPSIQNLEQCKKPSFSTDYVGVLFDNRLCCSNFHKELSSEEVHDPYATKRLYLALVGPIIEYASVALPRKHHLVFACLFASLWKWVVFVRFKIRTFIPRVSFFINILLIYATVVYLILKPTLLNTHAKLLILMCA